MAYLKPSELPEIHSNDLHNTDLIVISSDNGDGTYESKVTRIDSIMQNQVDGVDIILNTDNFNNKLSSSEYTVQLALNKLDAYDPLDDYISSPSSHWSSLKTHTAITQAINAIPINDPLDDSVISPGSHWSSFKTNAEIDNAIGLITYTNTEPMPEDIHDIKSGTTFSNVSYEEMFTKILYPFQYPEFTSFSVSDGPILELGQTLDAARTATFNCSNVSNILTDSINIVNDVGNLNLVDSPVTMTNAAITKTEWSDRTHTFTINGTDIEGNDFNRNYNIRWDMNYYVGSSVSTSLDEVGINSELNKVLENNFNRTYSFTTPGYKYFIYPSDWPTMTTFKDTSTNLDVPMIPLTTVDITSQGLTKSYNIHRTSNNMSGNINIGVS